MNIQGLKKAKVLSLLYNGSKPQGLSFLQNKSSLSETEAAQIIENSDTKYFDYLHGRVLKIDLSGDEIDTRLYNRDNGEGAAEKIIDDFRKLLKHQPIRKKPVIRN